MRSRLTVTAGVLACVLLGTAPGVAGADPRPAPLDSAGSGGGEITRDSHSSDGRPGPIARQLPASGRGAVQRSEPTSYDVAPGVRFTRWDESDLRGPVRLQLLTVDPSVPGVALGYANPGRVAGTAPVLSMARRDGAVAAVNGDFFDIDGTGAPLGVGVTRRGVLHAPRGGWNASFYLSARGRPEIGSLPMRAEIRQRPSSKITNLNSPRVKPGGIGIYTRDWGRTSGYRVTDGQRRNVRMVVVRHGRVAATKQKLTKNQRIQGTLLVGRGKGARALSKLRKGARADVRWWLEDRPRMAIGGNKFLILDGIVQVVDDREMHPRTAVGIDRDTGEVLLLTVDGRQPSSRGFTMVELASTMMDLGADEALNLDGGGSSTMVARKPNGRVGVLNSPSEGRQRRVANTLQVFSTAPPIGP